MLVLAELSLSWGRGVNRTRVWKVEIRLRQPPFPGRSCPALPLWRHVPGERLWRCRRRLAETVIAGQGFEPGGRELPGPLRRAPPPDYGLMEQEADQAAHA